VSAISISWSSSCHAENNVMQVICDTCHRSPWLKRDARLMISAIEGRAVCGPVARHEDRFSSPAWPEMVCGSGQHDPMYRAVPGCSPDMLDGVKRPDKIF
jgi:hypothetical protein